jgi:hypothetical protein
MGIDNYYFNNIDGKLVPDNYWDFHLTSDNQGMSLPYATSCSGVYGTDEIECDLGSLSIIQDNDLVFWFDINNTGTTSNGSILSSLVDWTGTTITPSSGMTLSDFGLCGVDNGRVTGLTDTLIITSGDTTLKLYPVTGDTYTYPWSQTSGSTAGNCDIGKTICLTGGFYQGFFKIDFEKPAPISATSVTTNPGCSTSASTTTVTKGDPDAKVYELMPTTFDKGWTMETWVKGGQTCGSTTGLTLNDVYTDNDGFFFYIGTRAENKFHNVFSGETGYTTTNIPLNPETEVNEGLNGGQDWFSISQANTIGGFNPFKNCTCVNESTGTTTSSVTSGTTYNHCNELGENALGFRITSDGRIGWRKLTVTGECRNNKDVITGTTMEEEYTTDSVIMSGDTASLIQVVYIQGSGVKFGLPTGTLKILVNGRLVLKSKDFIGLQLRALNEWSDKQQGVPYNISWGGGTQGLVESETFGGPDPADDGLLIETNFAGTFEGELSQLRFYKRPLNILELRNNLYVDCGRYCVRETYGGYHVIQPNSGFCSDCLPGCPIQGYLLHDDCFIITEYGQKIIIDEEGCE